MSLRILQNFPNGMKTSLNLPNGMKILEFGVARGAMAGSKGAMAPYILKIIEYSEILMCRAKIFRLLVLAKIKVLNYTGKSLNLAPLIYKCHDTSGCTSASASASLTVSTCDSECKITERVQLI